jgi:hypothetical protein
MNKSLTITATLDQPDLLEDLVEKLAQRKDDAGFSNPEVFVSGTMGIADDDTHFDIPFVTRFVFTCFEEGDDTYYLACGASLS